MADFPTMGQGPMKPITDPESIEAQRDEIGYTNPNLHRRLSSNIPEDVVISIGIYGKDSYRMITTPGYDDESRDSEIP